MSKSSRHSRRVARVTTYAFWNAFGIIIPLFLDRLVVHPVLQRELGESVFGGLIWVLGVVNLVGFVGSAGFSTLLMRDYAKYSPAVARLAFRCSLLLSAVISLVLLATTALSSSWIADQVVQENAWALYVPLVVVGMLRSITHILYTSLRIQRAFRTIFYMQALEALVVSSILLIADRESLWLIGLIYVASALVGMPLAFWNIDDLRSNSKWWDLPTAKMLMGSWFAGAMLSIINNSQIYLSRLIVGVMAGAVQVTVLYPGIAISNIFTMPVTILAQLVLSLLGGTSRFVLSGKKATLYFAAVVLFSAVLSAFSWLAGEYVVEYLYPEIASDTLEFYGWLAVANGFTCVMMMLRSVMLKYSPLWISTWLQGVVLAIQIVGLLVLVPSRQAAGAAQASCLSAIVSAVLFTVFYFRMIRIRSSTTEAVVPTLDD
ncbi:MAG: hypothetical protein KDA87_18940 [Planctomycetales bacterium]|nr:hypothetical protein [Planctomycetales bacterium]